MVKFSNSDLGETKGLGSSSLCCQIILWIVIIFLIACRILYGKTPTVELNIGVSKIILLVFFYLCIIAIPIILIIYYIDEFSCGVYNYLKEITKTNNVTNIVEFMKKFYKDVPDISFEIKRGYETQGGYDLKTEENYEYRYDPLYKQYYYQRVTNLKSVYNPDKKIFSLETKNSFPFSIYSYRDISDNFAIDNKITYLELTIYQKLYFADEISLLDAKNERNKIEQKKEREIDLIYFTIKKSKVLNHKLIINNNIFLSRWCYVFFVIIGMAQLYKMYLRSICKNATLTLKKIVSTRDDLFSDSNNKLYQSLNPKIIHKNTLYKFKNENCGYTDKSMHPEIPNQKEIEETKTLNNRDEICILEVIKNTDIHLNTENNLFDLNNEYKAFE